MRDDVQYPDRYEAATKARIRANAKKGKAARWLAADPTREALVAQIREHVGIDPPPAVQAIWDSYKDAGWGEVPEDELPPEDAKVINEWRRARRYTHPFVAKMWDALDEWGSLTEGQERAVRAAFVKMAEGDEVRAAKKAEQAAKDAGSVHVGEVGKRQDFVLTLQSVFAVETMYGTLVIHRFTDGDGNVVVYKGKTLGREVERPADPERPWTKGQFDFVELAKGETVTMKATVKAHGEYQGVKQTVVSRPKLA